MNRCLQRTAALLCRGVHIVLIAVAMYSCVCLLGAQSTSWQATSDTTGTYLYTTNNVGIGNTGTPGVPLTLYQNTPYGKELLLDTLATGEQAYIWFGDAGSPKFALGKHTDNSFTFWDQTQSRNVFHVLSSGNLSLQPNGGNVGIGTEAPQYPLSVNGTIQAKEVIVNTGWADYVFAPSYRLQPLSSVARYINKNHHLPGVPSEADVTAHGVSLGDMQSTLLAKVEELTLHVIQLDAAMRRLEKENNELKAERSASAEKPVKVHILRAER